MKVLLEIDIIPFFITLCLANAIKKAKPTSPWDTGSMKDKKLQATVTSEIAQPIRLYYQIADPRRLLARFRKLRCLDFDSAEDRWVWLYADEAKTLKFKKSYSSIPPKLHPIVIGSFFIRGNELLFNSLAID